MIKSIATTGKYTVIFKLKHPSRAFIPAIAMPFNFIYAKNDLDQHGHRWHQRNINGTGAFTFVEHQTGAFVRGKRFDGYHFEGKPYLDGFRAISAPKLASRLLAIESDRAAIEFRGFPPKSRDNLVKALGDRVTVQQTDWNCSLLLIPNHKRKPFDDPRVRRALNLALDRWGGSKYLPPIAIVKTVGGIVYPKHPLAATNGELEAMEGYWPDIHRSREMAKKLLKDAGQENLEFTLSNRGVDQPYKLVGTWAIDQWRRIGVHAKQDVVPTGVWLNRLFKGNFDMSTGANCQSVVNPISDISTFLCSADNNLAGCKDQTLEDLYATMVRTSDAPKQRRLMREFERRVISEQAHILKTLWWQRIAVYRSYVRGWKISPSHYLNQHLDQIWLDR